MKLQVSNYANNFALGSVTISGTDAEGISTQQILFNRSYPQFTFATMLAPSPDWFLGLNHHELIDAEGLWVEDTGAINLAVYDAGTETGSTFSLNGTDTVPAEVISRLTENVNGEVNFVDGTVNGNYIATIQFQRIE